MEYVYPDKRVQVCWSVYVALTSVFFVLLSGFFFALSSLPRGIALAFTVAWSAGYVFLLTVYFPLRRRRLRYRIDGDSINVISGVYFRNSRRFSYDAIRHFIVFDGPLERLFGIRYVLLCATGGRLILEGLTPEQADTLTRRVV